MTRKEICDKARNVRRAQLLESFSKRFWERVDKNTGTECWHWAGQISSRGYGEVKKVGKKMMAHRASYELVNGNIPDGQYVLHKCDNPKCVRPDHLFVGTQSQNIIDCVSKRRWPRCKLTSEMVRSIRELARYFPQRDIAEQFGVARNTISQIVTRVSWKWM